MRVAVGLGTQLQLSFAELTALAGPAADLGFHRMWTHTRTVPDSFHVCESWWAEAARHRPGGIPVATGVLPAPQYWRPASLASQAATASELTGGRFTLGIGTGGYGADFWQSLGLPNRPIGVMREYVAVLRAALGGGAVDVDGSAISLRNFALDHAPPPVPIYLAALGPQMLRLAGECADGVLLNWATPETIAESERRVTEGAVAAGRKRSDVTMAMYLRCAVDDDVDAARRVVAAEILRKLAPQQWARRDAGATSGYRAQFAKMGFEDELAELERRFAAGASTAELLDDVSSELCGAASYFGTAADAPARVAELARGLDEVIVWVVTSRPGVEPIIETMQALAPEKVTAAAAALH